MKLETLIRKRVTDVKFIPAKSAKYPTQIGWIQYCDSGYQIKGIGLHDTGEGYCAWWPWWQTNSEILFYNKPESKEFQLILVELFVEAMNECIGGKKKAIAPESESHVVLKKKVETAPRGQKTFVGDDVVYVTNHTRKYPHS